MKDIEQYLRENAPQTPDEGQFMIETNARLDAVEGIKATVDGENRRWRVALIIALVAGLALGCLMTALMLLYPVQPQQAAEGFLARAAEYLGQWKPVLYGFVASCAVALGIVALTGRRSTV